MSPIADSPFYSVYVARKFGSIYTAILFCELLKKYHYQKDNAPSQEWFPYTQVQCEERTMLTRTQQEKSIEQLQNLGLINKKRAGMPPKRCFRITQKGKDFLEKCSRIEEVSLRLEPSSK